MGLVSIHSCRAELCLWIQALVNSFLLGLNYRLRALGFAVGSLAVCAFSLHICGVNMFEREIALWLQVFPKM